MTHGSQMSGSLVQRPRLLTLIWATCVSENANPAVAAAQSPVVRIFGPQHTNVLGAPSSQFLSLSATVATASEACPVDSQKGWCDLPTPNALSHAGQNKISCGDVSASREFRSAAWGRCGRGPDSWLLYASPSLLSRILFQGHPSFARCHCAPFQ